jgi:thiol-disulfide isomerase/thioredoxin
LGLHLAPRSAPPSEANADRTGRYACTLSKDKVKVTLLRSALIVGAALISSMGALAQVKLGDPAPPLLGYNKTGEKILVPDLKGTVVVVTFWASWCAPCLKELPMLESLQKAVGNSKLRVVAVNIEDRQQFRQASRAMYDWNITVAHDPVKECSAAFGVKGIPHMVIISRDGNIKKIFRGYSEESLPDVVEEVANALNE